MRNQQRGPAHFQGVVDLRRLISIVERRGRQRGFEARQVRTGREDDDDVEIVSGLAPGETIAIANTFTLRAELEKADASEHEH